MGSLTLPRADLKRVSNSQQVTNSVKKLGAEKKEGGKHGLGSQVYLFELTLHDKIKLSAAPHNNMGGNRATKRSLGHGCRASTKTKMRILVPVVRK